MEEKAQIFILIILLALLIGILAKNFYDNNTPVLEAIFPWQNPQIGQGKIAGSGRAKAQKGLKKPRRYEREMPEEYVSLIMKPSEHNDSDFSQSQSTSQVQKFYPNQGRGQKGMSQQLSAPHWPRKFVINHKMAYANKDGTPKGMNKKPGDKNNLIKHLEEKLFREYARVQTAQKILFLEKHDRFFSCMERLFSLMANDLGSKPDEIFIDITPEHGYFKELRAYTDILSQDQINSLIHKIVINIQSYLAETSFPAIEYYVEHDQDGKNASFHCGNIFRRFAPEIYQYWMYSLDRYCQKMGPEYDEEVKDLLMLNMIARYESLINRHRTFNLPTAFYKVLKDKYGIKNEGFASPMNARLVVIEFLEKGRVDDCTYNSLFFDTDEPFGSKGNFFLAGDNELCDSTAIMALSFVLYPRIYKKIWRMRPECRIFTVKAGQDIDFNDPNWHTRHIEAKDIHYEDHAKQEVPIKFSYAWAEFVYNFHIDDEDFRALALPKAMRDSNYAQNRKLVREFVRYTYVEKMVDLQNVHGKMLYEWKNILERFLLTLSNISAEKIKEASMAGCKMPEDEVFYNLPANHAAYQKMAEEMKAKRLKNVDETLTSIRLLIEEFLNADSSKWRIVKFYIMDGNLYLNYQRQLIKTNIPKTRLTLFTHLLAGANYDANLEVSTMYMRYMSILSGHQQWNIPFTFYEYLYDAYGLRLEGFASPLNSQILILNDLKGYNARNTFYCSLFYDVDKVFGSKGNIFDFDIDANRESPDEPYTICLNPPFIEDMFTQMIDLIDKWFNQHKNVRVFTGCPSWSDAAFFKRLKTHKALKFTQDLKYGEFHYEDSSSREIMRVQVRSGYSLFVLANYEKPDNEPDYSTIVTFMRHYKY